jgi:hypothetical protein
MLKPDSLRAALTAADPELARDPQQLIMWIDQGAIASPMTAALHFTYAYQLNVLLIGYARKQLPLAFAMLQWLRVQQPDLLTPGKSAVTFEVDFMDNSSVDLQFKLQLTEQVRVAPDDDGVLQLQLMPEPDPLFPGDLGIGDIEPIPPLSEIWFDGERLVPEPPLPVGAP